jgi:hypothetical protein
MVGEDGIVEARWIRRAEAGVGSRAEGLLAITCLLISLTWFALGCDVSSRECCHVEAVGTSS